MTRAPAVVFRGVDAVALQDVEMPPPAAGQVQIRTECSGIGYAPRHRLGA